MVTQCVAFFGMSEILQFSANIAVLISSTSLNDQARSQEIYEVDLTVYSRKTLNILN